MNKLKENKFLTALIASGVVLFAVIAFVVVKSTSTLTAIVPNQQIPAGTKVDESMLKSIQIPSNTPKGYITDKNSLIGQKLKITVSENQLLYIGNVMSSWDDFNDGETIPDDYIVTSIQIPANRAVGGLITAGDTVDILGIPNSEYSTVSKETLNNYLGGMASNAYGANGMNAYWVLSNVKILETDSSLSQSNEASISTVTEDNGSSNGGDYYIVALSYDDYKKLRLSEQYLDLWMNIAPDQNDENGPDLNKMNNPNIQPLADSQKQTGKAIQNTQPTITTNNTVENANVNENEEDEVTEETNDENNDQDNE